MLPSITSLRHTGSGLLSARAGRCGSKSDFLSINVVLPDGIAGELRLPGGKVIELGSGRRRVSCSM